MKVVEENKLSQHQVHELIGLIEKASKDKFLDNDVVEDAGRHVIVEDDHSVVGFFTPRKQSWDEATAWRPGALYVFQSHRGKGLMKTALKEFYQKHKRGVAWVDDDNSASIKLFTSLGFTKEKAKEFEGKAGHWWVLKEVTKPKLTKW